MLPHHDDTLSINEQFKMYISYTGIASAVVCCHHNDTEAGTW